MESSSRGDSEERLLSVICGGLGNAPVLAGRERRCIMIDARTAPETMPMTAFAFVTTCKGRLHHLQQTLPLIVAEAPDEIVVVDYGCPQGSGDWVEANYPQVKVVRVTDDDGFRLARARNLGAAACSAPWICFIDADIRVGSGFVAWMRANARQRHYYR